jgi:hypothetical protein
MDSSDVKSSSDDFNPPQTVAQNNCELFHGITQLKQLTGRTFEGKKDVSQTELYRCAIKLLPESSIFDTAKISKFFFLIIPSLFHVSYCVIGFALRFSGWMEMDWMFIIHNIAVSKKK